MMTGMHEGGLGGHESVEKTRKGKWGGREMDGDELVRVCTK